MKSIEHCCLSLFSIQLSKEFHKLKFEIERNLEGQTRAPIREFEALMNIPEGQSSQCIVIPLDIEKW
ncbi:MAG: hypothetical protein V2I33_24105, partial [Kangiellaceae bacterium]|nr:hypothetical protein [Kangiellaceae bacterium]